MGFFHCLQRQETTLTALALIKTALCRAVWYIIHNGTSYLLFFLVSFTTVFFLTQKIISQTVTSYGKSNQRFAPFSFTTSAYQYAESFHIRFCVSKST